MNKEIKQNDMLLATLANPTAKANDFLNNNVNPLNTQLLDKDYYKSKAVIKDQFTTADGKFDEMSFDNAYKAALYNYNQISNEEFIKGLDEVEYDPFNVMRPKKSKTYNVDVKFSSDYNPFKQLYSRNSINSITDSTFSLREIAQKGRIYDPETNSWSDSVNRLSLIDKFFGDTLVYAQWDEDGVHIDPINGNTVNHKKGDWKIDDTGNLYLEKLGNREVYGKQVVSTSDILTTDGSVFNKFDFFDSDGREKSVGRTAVKTLVEIAPLLIPGVNTVYGGTRAALGLMSVLPTFYKSLEGLLLGDSKNYGNDPVTKAESWLAKFNQQSTSDAGSAGLWNFEQMSSMVTSIFSQIYEQRAMASLSTMLVKPDKLLNKKIWALKGTVYEKALPIAEKKGIDLVRAMNEVVEKTPEIQKAIARQSQLSKALSLGYMALTSTGDVYGEAVDSGYDRRTAGFASLLTASGQYGIMMNNRMGDWFLDKTTGYDVNVNRALISKSVKPWLQEISDIFKSGESIAVKKTKLAAVAEGFKKGLNTIFNSPSSVKEAMWKNMIVEGVEEVTEQVVEDATKGIIDVMNYLGLTKGKGDFRTLERYATGEAYQEYLANFVGGLLGGGLFELERSVISPWIQNKGKISPEVRKEIYDLVANGHKDDLIREIKKQGKYLVNSHLSTVNEDGEFTPAENGLSQADVAIEKAIEMIEQLDATFNSGGVNLTDEEIINKAIRNQILIAEFDNNKVEGKYVGLEGLVLDDFKNNAVKISEIKDRITELRKDEENNKDQIKLEQEKLKPLIAKRDNILSGDYSMEYFDRLALALNPELKEIFGSLDKNTFTKAKYNKEYIDLPDTGSNLSKETVDAEWQDFLDSTDMKAKLEFMTNAYKELEKTLNPHIKKHVDSGYTEVRKQVQKHVLDLERTILQFNTATDPTVRQSVLNNFISINNQLESLGLTKVAPWTVINYDNFEELMNLGLIKKSVTTTDSSGNVTETLEDYSSNELNAVEENGKTFLENLKEDFNSFAKHFPTNPLNIEEVIKSYNSYVVDSNNDTQLKLDKLRSLNSTDPKVLEEITKLERQFKYTRIANVEITPLLAKEISKVNNDITTKINSEIAAYSDKSIYDKYKNILNNKDYFEKDFNTLLQENGLNTDSFDDLELVDIVKFLKALEESKILDLAKENFRGQEAEKVLNELEGTTDKESLKEIFNYLKDTINANNAILNDKTLENLHNYVLTKNSELETYIEENKPEFFKIKNVAFDFLLDYIQKEGFNDKELYYMLKDMFERELDPFIKSLLPGFDSLSQEDIIYILNNKDDVFSELVTFASNYENYMDTGDGTLGYILQKEEDNFFELDYLKKLLINNFSPDKQISELLDSFYEFGETFKSLMKNQNIIEKFLDYESKKDALKSNPLYDFIRNFSLILNSNPENKINKIFDILQKEENLFRASSGASNFESDNIREQDIQQAINMLDMITAVINSMSTTSYYGDDLNGFIAMRQRFAKENNLKDDVLKLFTIDSDQAATMMMDIKSLRTRLNFIKDLAYTNSLKIAAEHETIRNNMTVFNIATFENIAKNASLSKFIPKDFEEIFEKHKDEETKLTELEESFYKHNKDQKVEALETLLKYEFTDSNGQRVDVNRRNNITKDTRREELTPYTKIIYLTTVLETSIKDFHKMYLETLDKMNKAPFYMQELNARIGVASVRNPKLFSLISELKQDSTNDDLNHITFIVGGAGTGKTSVVSATIVDIIRQTNKSSKIWLAAPNQDQAKNFENVLIDSIGEELLSLEALDKKKLFDAFGDNIGKLWEEINSAQKDINNNTGDGKLFKYVDTPRGSYLKFELPSDWDSGVDFSVLPNLLMIDEATHFSKAEWILLQAISERSLNAGNFMKIIGLGDPNQMGFQINTGDSKNPEYLTFNINAANAIFTPTLMTTVRSTNDQKRVNNDFLLLLANKSSEIFNRHNADQSLDAFGIRDKSNAEFKADYLNNVKQNIGLKYYLDEENFMGDYIQTNPKDLTVLKTIKRKLDSSETKPSISILTLNGKLDPDLEQALNDAGFIPEDYKIYTVDNIQGSEADYFLFNTDLIRSYDKIRDSIKALYTYVSRSKVGTLIFDPNNKLKNDFSLTNAERSKYFVQYDPLTENVVSTLKNNRIDKINSLIGDHTLSDDKFKWPGESVDDSDDSDDRDDGDDFKGGGDDSTKGRKFTTKTFKPLLHNFYNNTNAKITDDGLIEVDNSRTPTDLNGLKNIVSAEVAERIIKEWGHLKSELFHNLGTRNIKTSRYKRYFKHIFPIDLSKDEDINIDFVITLSKFDAVYNVPYQKSGLDLDEMLKSSDPFVNVSAKLTYNGKIHYVTLSTFPKETTLMLNIMNNIEVEGNTTEEKEKSKKEIKDWANKVTKVFSDIKAKANILDSSDIIELADLESKDLETITSTRLITTETNGKKDTFNLLQVQDLIGVRVSEIKIYPKDLREFKNLYRKYTFGDPISDKKLEELHEKLANKPYVIVSYANDLRGSSNSDKTIAKLVPVLSTKRTVDILIKESTEAYNNFTKDISEYYRKPESTRGEFKFNPILDVKSQMLLDKPGILDLLIKLSQIKNNSGESLLDTLIKKDGKTSAIEVLSVFREGADLSKILQVIKIVQEETAKGIDKNTKFNIFNKLKGISFWDRNFHYLFAYKDIIKDAKTRKNITATKDQLNNFEKIIDEAVNTLLNDEVAYNLPIVNSANGLIVNSIVNGNSGFSDDFLHDKFTIGGTIEAPRVLLSMDKFLSLDTSKKPIQSNPKPINTLGIISTNIVGANHLTIIGSGKSGLYSINTSTNSLSINVTTIEELRNSKDKLGNLVQIEGDLDTATRFELINDGLVEKGKDNDWNIKLPIKIKVISEKLGPKSGKDVAINASQIEIIKDGKVLKPLEKILNIVNLLEQGPVEEVRILGEDLRYKLSMTSTGDSKSDIKIFFESIGVIQELPMIESMDIVKAVFKKFPNADKQIKKQVNDIAKEIAKELKEC